MKIIKTKQYYVESLLLLTIVGRHLGTEELNCLTFGRGMLSHYYLIEDSSCHFHRL